jgi:uncharacterized SAM-binding protein YcdF (DUF218 family)
MEAKMLADALRVLGSAPDPAHLLGVLVLASAIAALLARRRLALLLQCGCAAIVIFVGVLPGGKWLVLPLEARFPADPPLPARIDGILTIGGTERIDQSVAWGQPTLSDPTPIAAFIALGRRYPEAKMVFTGGGATRAGGARVTEATIVHDFLAELGLDADRIRYEDRSRNTRENAVFSYDLVRPKPGERWILVAQAVSIPRVVGAFRKAGWQVIPFPAGYLTDGDGEPALSLHLRSGLDFASTAVHEWGGLLAYRLLGYTDDWLPQ